MPREESENLKTIERAGADEAISNGLDGMAESYTAYMAAIQAQLGVAQGVSRGFKGRVSADLKRRLLAAD